MGHRRVQRCTSAITTLALVIGSFPLPGSDVDISAIRVQPATDPVVTSPAGTLNGSFDVTTSGTARYTIPLSLAAGRGGIEPRLILAYDSADGDGPLGVGWTLEGFSQIERCPSTLAVHNRLRPIRWDADDPLCLDGQPLVLVSGTAHADGAVYYTDRQSFRRIVGVGTPHRGFRVQLANGLTMSYGETPECGDACLAMGRVKGGIPRHWMAASMHDRFGNYMLIEWSRRAGPATGRTADSTGTTDTEEHLPRRIRYTGSKTVPALTPQRLVEIIYEDRPDPSFGYSAGVRTIRTQRVSRIVSSVAGLGVFREYRFTYAASRSSGRSLLTGVAECAGDGVCHPPTTFGWSDAPREWTGTGGEHTPIEPGSGQSFVTRRRHIGGLFIADINGDGRSDLVYTKERPGRPRTRRTWRIALAYPTDGATLNGDAPPLPLCRGRQLGTYRCEIDTGIEAPLGVSAQSLDYNRDGRTDLLVVETRSDVPRTNWKILQSTGNGFTLVNTYISDERFTTGNMHPLHRVHLADVNGDGGTDLITCQPRLDVGPGQPWRVRYHTGTGWGQDRMVIFPPEGGQDCRTQPVMVLDANGDSAADLLIGGHETNYWAAIFTGDAVTYQATGISTIVGSFWSSNQRAYFTEARSVDVNGDGLLDVVADADLPQSQGTLDVWLNTGTGFSSPGGSTDGYDGLPDQTSTAILPMSQLVDYNGDSRGDLLISTGCPEGINSGPCAVNPRWQVLQATGEPVQQRAANASVFRRRELPECRIGGVTLGCIDHRKGSSAAGAGAWYGYQQTRVADVDGDLLPDLVQVEEDHVVVRLNRGPSGGDRIVQIRDGLAWSDVPTIEVEYRPSTDGRVVDSTSQVCALPVSCERPDRYVVSAHRTDRGPGHEPLEVRHRYAEPRRDTTGEGWLGFKRYTATNTVTNATSTVVLHDATPVARPNGGRRYPLTRLPHQRMSTVPLGGGRVRSVSAEYDLDVRQFWGSHTYYVVTEQVVTTTREGEGAVPPVLAMATTSMEFDSWGNTRLVRTDNGATLRSTIAEYYNNEAQWLIGVMREATIRESVAGETLGSTQVRTLDEATGRITRIDTESPPVASATLGYDAVGNLIEVVETDTTASTPRATHSSYDADPERLFPGSSRNPLGHETRFEYDRKLGVITKETDPNGFVTQLSYDGFGRFARRLRRGFATTRVTRELVTDGVGRTHTELTEEQDQGARRTLVFDRLGRRIREQRATHNNESAVVDTVYDRLGRLATRTVPYVGTRAGSEQWEFDSLNRPVAVTRADGSSVTWLRAGLTTTATDSLGRVTRTRVDVNESPVEVIDPLGNTVRYEYGPFGALRRVIDTGGHVTDVRTDARGHILMQANPDTGRRTFDYDGFGRLTAVHDALGRTVTLEYDALDRMIARRDADGIATYRYDEGVGAIGFLSTAVGPAKTQERYERDELGRVVRISSTLQETVITRTATYDDLGRVEKATVATGTEEPLSLAYQYAADGSVREVRTSDQGPAAWRVVARNARGQITAETTGSGIRTLRTIEPNTGLITAIRSTAGNQQPLFSLDYRYDTEGNPTLRRDNVAAVEERLTYDELDRLVESEICRTGSCEDPRRVEYDPLGNIISKWDVGEYEYDGTSPHAVTLAGGIKYEYDLVGNQIQRGDERRTFNARDMLASIEEQGRSAESLVYDAFGRLAITRQASRSTTRVGAYERHTENGSVTERLTIGAGNRPVAVVRRRDGKTAIDFVHSDSLGTPMVVTDGAAQVIARTAHDAFGQTLDLSWAGAVADLPEVLGSRGFTAHVQLRESSLVHTGGRTYDARLARFLSADPFVPAPLNSQSLNRYSYVRNNPLKYTDPTGYQEECGECEMEPLYFEDMDETHIEGDPGGQDSDADSDSDTSGPDDTGSYDDGSQDTDDGDPDPEEDGPAWDGDDIEIDWSSVIGDAANDVADVAESIDRAVEAIAGVLGDLESPISIDDVGTAVGVVTTAAIVVGGSVIVYTVVEGLAAGGALSGAAGTVPKPIDFSGPTPPAPATYQPRTGGINFAESPFGHWIEDLPQAPGLQDVAIHHPEGGFSLPGTGPVTPQQLAQMIKDSPRYNGGAIRLLSCGPGAFEGGAAQQVANALGQPVMAVQSDLHLSGMHPGLLSLDQVTWMPPSQIPWLHFMPQVP